MPGPVMESQDHTMSNQDQCTGQKFIPVPMVLAACESAQHNSHICKHASVANLNMCMCFAVQYGLSQWFHKP